MFEADNFSSSVSSLARESADDLLLSSLEAMSVFVDDDDGRLRVCAWYNRRLF